MPVIKAPVIKVPESPATVGLPKVPRKVQQEPCKLVLDCSVQQEPQAQAEAVNLSGAKRR